MTTLLRLRPLGLFSFLVLVLGACAPAPTTTTATTEAVATSNQQPVTIIESDRFTAELEGCRRIGSTTRVRCTVSYTNLIDASAYRAWRFSYDNVAAVDVQGNAYAPKEIKRKQGERARPGGELLLVLGYRDTKSVEVTFHVPTGVHRFSTLTFGTTEFRHIAF